MLFPHNCPHYVMILAVETYHFLTESIFKSILVTLGFELMEHWPTLRSFTPSSLADFFGFGIKVH